MEFRPTSGEPADSIFLNDGLTARTIPTRLWGMEQDTCAAVIDQLVATAYLRWTDSGAVTRAES